MSTKRVTPDEAAELLDQGWTYVDVRSVPEFDEGHPAGAFNVPVMHRQGGQMTANTSFVDVMVRRFPKDTKLLIGCRSGGRSQRAVEMLANKGFEELIDVRGGFGGETDAAGKTVVEGWQARQLPVATRAEPGHSYEELERA